MTPAYGEKGKANMKKNKVEPIKMGDTLDQFSEHYSITYDPATGMKDSTPPVQKLINKRVSVGKRVFLNVRSKPTIESRVVMTLANGDKLKVFSEFEHDEFYKVETANGKIGYCVKKFIK